MLHMSCPALPWTDKHASAVAVLGGGLRVESVPPASQPGHALTYRVPGLSMPQPPLRDHVRIFRRAGDTFSICTSLLLSSILCVTRNFFLPPFHVFFSISSLTPVSREGSLHDNIINILILSWFFSRLPGRKKHDQAV